MRYGLITLALWEIDIVSNYVLEHEMRQESPICSAWIAKSRPSAPDLAIRRERDLAKHIIRYAEGSAFPLTGREASGDVGKLLPTVAASYMQETLSETVG